MTPLRFAITSPPSGCEGDLHPQAVNHARRTKKARRDEAAPAGPHFTSVFFVVLTFGRGRRKLYCATNGLAVDF
jgi:hypothetical protein